MINIIDKHNCCGCTACVQRCPKQCISSKVDEEGFIYPHVNLNECIDCHLCEKVCPLINHHNKIQPFDVLAVKNQNEDERIKSSSGGIFYAIAKEIIKKGGVVFGAVFNDNWEVVHTYTETIDGIRPMMGSKYVQSRINNCYKEAEFFLKSGRNVLFSGTPCQITGLHDYLRKEYPNLISVDFLCHGVPSPKVWQKYLDEKLNSLNLNSTIKNIQFRDKKARGWKKFSFVINDDDKENNCNEESYLLSEFHKDNSFMKGFLSNVYLRPSCHNCKCKNGISHSDLTLGDFWGIELISPEFDDDKGISLVLVNSDKGKSLLYSLNIDTQRSSISIAKKLNGGFKEKSIPHSKRKFFFKNIDNCNSIIKLIEDCSKPTLKFKILNKLNYISHKMIKYKR